MMPTSYLAAARRLRHYAAMIERYARAGSPRERQQLTRAIHGAALFTRTFSARHRNVGLGLIEAKRKAAPKRKSSRASETGTKLNGHFALTRRK